MRMRKSAKSYSYPSYVCLLSVCLSYLSVRLSVLRHGTSLFSLDNSSRNLIFQIFRKDVQIIQSFINHLAPNDPYMIRTALLTSKLCILYIFSTNVGTEYFKHALCSPFFSLQNAVCFIMLTCLVPVLFTFYIQDVLKLKENNSGSKELKSDKNNGYFTRRPK